MNASSVDFVLVSFPLYNGFVPLSSLLGMFPERVVSAIISQRLLAPSEPVCWLERPDL